MKKLILVAAFAALCPALAQAQASGGDCNALRNSANVGAGAQWTADQAKPYMDKMAAMAVAPIAAQAYPVNSTCAIDRGSMGDDMGGCQSPNFPQGTR